MRRSGAAREHERDRPGWGLTRAADRLRNSDDSLAAIAADVGYDSEAAFKRVTGLIPGRWRDGMGGTTGADA